MPTGIYQRKPYTKEHREKIRQSKLGRRLSEETKAKIGKSQVGRIGTKGPKHKLWKGDDAQYCTVHTWLRRRYGKANTCEAKGCDGYYKKYQWALKNGKKHVHNRENYMMLCIGCHSFYDIRIRNKGRYIGIKPSKNKKRWMAIINFRGKCIYLGTFDAKEDAAKAYEEAAYKLYPQVYPA